MDEERPFVLCFVSGSQAVFTNAGLERQTGDDWDDAPYEHNAGMPYEWREYQGEPRYELLTLFWEAPGLVTPDYNELNSPYSVDQINAGVVPWLRTERWADKQGGINAGATLDEFRRFIWDMGGNVYERVASPTTPAATEKPE